MRTQTSELQALTQRNDLHPGIPNYLRLGMPVALLVCLSLSTVIFEDKRNSRNVPRTRKSSDRQNTRRHVLSTNCNTIKEISPRRLRLLITKIWLIKNVNKEVRRQGFTENHPCMTMASSSELDPRIGFNRGVIWVKLRQL